MEIKRPFSDDEFQATPEPVRLYIVQFEEIVSKLLNETEDLKKRVAKLENRVNLNSQNSSKPSSSDSPFKKPLKKKKSKGTIDNYARAVRRISLYFDCCPDKLTPDQLEDYFSQFLDTHSWSTVKVERNGLQFFWRHTLKIDWKWINMVKPPQIKTIPDVLSPNEIEQLIGTTRKLRYQVFFLTTYSMGMRLSEALSLQVREIDADLKRVHVRYGKGKKDRFVPLPDLTLQALRVLWSKHRHPKLLFPNAKGSLKTI